MINIPSRNHYRNHYHPYVSALAAYTPGTTLPPPSVTAFTHTVPVINISETHIFVFFFSLYPPKRLLFSLYLPFTLPKRFRSMRIPTIFSSNLPAHSTQDLVEIRDPMASSEAPYASFTSHIQTYSHNPSSS